MEDEGVGGGVFLSVLTIYFFVFIFLTVFSSFENLVLDWLLLRLSIKFVVSYPRRKQDSRKRVHLFHPETQIS